MQFKKTQIPYEAWFSSYTGKKSYIYLPTAHNIALKM